MALGDLSDNLVYSNELRKSEIENIKQMIWLLLMDLEVSTLGCMRATDLCILQNEKDEIRNRIFQLMKDKKTDGKYSFFNKK